MPPDPKAPSSVRPGYARAVACLEDGGLLLLPTDALWSVGADGTDPVAVERICNLLGSRDTREFELLFDAFPMLYTYVEALHPRLETLLAYHRRPLTFLCRPNGLLPARLLHPDGRIAARVACDIPTRELIARFGRPLVTAFAGGGLPVRLDQVAPGIRDGVDAIFNVASPPVGTARLPVKVVLTEEEELVFLRE